MSDGYIDRTLKTVPEGYVAIAVCEAQMSAVMRICVLVKQEPDPVGGQLVVLRTTLDTKVFLGCIVDTSGQVFEWIEIRIQSDEMLLNAPLAQRIPLSNALLDQRWQRQFESLSESATAEIFKAGWETSHPLPTYLDKTARSPFHPRDPKTQAAWQLCMDEAVLQKKGLPSYSNSLHRYLYLPAQPADSLFVPITPEAPTNDATQSMEEILPSKNGFIPFNPRAGLMLVSRHYPLSLEDFLALLEGESYQGIRHGQSTLGAQQGAARDPSYPLDQTYPGRLLLASQGAYGRLVETFHLKLRLLHDVLSCVHGLISRTQHPLLSLSADAFRVTLDPAARTLPFLWTARVCLVESGSAIGVAVGPGNPDYYVTPLIAETSVYRPLSTSLPPKGRALIRIRKVFTDSEDTVTVEGTFSTQESIKPMRSDLVAMYLNLAATQFSLHAHLTEDSALASGEWRFRALLSGLEETRIRDLQAAEGVPMPEVPFEVLPLLSTPYDLYALAILATRILLVDASTSLPVAVDEVLSLAREVQAHYDSSQSLPAQVSQVFLADERWSRSLGPQHLIAGDLAPEDALGPIPEDLWWDTLALIIEMLSGLEPVSRCRDYGDAPPGGLHTIFQPTLTELETLILKTRSLVVSDAQANQQIVSVIQKHMVALAASEQGSNQE